MSKEEKWWSLYRRPRSPFWWISVTVPGRDRIRASSRTSSKTEAKKEAARIAEREWDRRSNGEEATLTFAEAVMIYTAAGKDATYLDKLVKHFKNRLVADMKSGDLIAAARVIYPRASAATQNRQGIIPARAVINHAADLGRASFMKVKLLKESRPIRRSVDSDWLSAFQKAAPPHLGALALFMAYTGARIGQARTISWEKVNLQKGEVVVPAAKGFPERLAYLPPALVAALANIVGREHRLKKHRAKNLVFGITSRSSVYRQWQEACETAGIDYIPPHQSGRHTFFTEAIVRNKVDVKTAAVLGGSASPALLLKTYVHPEGGREVINGLFGTLVTHSPPAQEPKPLKRKEK